MFENENEKEAIQDSAAEEEIQQDMTTEEAPDEAPQNDEAAPKDRPKKNRKKMQQRTTAAVFAILMIAVVVLVNVMVHFLGQKVTTKVDLTSQKVLALSEETINLVKNLDQDVNIYSLIPQNQNDEILSILDNMLDRYQKLSPHIKYEKIDTTQNPQFAQKYQKTGETLNAYSIIFEVGSRFKVVDVNDTVSMNSQTSQAQYLSAEQKFSSALMYVTSNEDTKIAILQGHGEAPSSAFKSIIESENYLTQTLDLTTEEIPEDIKLIILAAPQTDFLAEEIEKLDRFFDRGGRAQILMDISTQSLPRLEGYLAEWGVTFQPGFVVENNKSNYLQSQLILLPNIKSTDMTQTIVENKLKVILPQARGIELSKVIGVETQELLTTTKDSFIRVDASNQSTAKADGDIQGPVTVAALLTKQMSEATAQIQVVGGTGFLNQSFLSESGFANKDFYLNSLSYMTEQTNSIYIRPKDVSPQILAISGKQALTYGGIVLVGIPLLILLAGLFIWLRRRHL